MSALPLGLTDGEVDELEALLRSAPEEDATTAILLGFTDELAGLRLLDWRTVLAYLRELS